MLSKTDKNNYRALLFRHIDGISLIGPISQLHKSKLATFIHHNDSFSIDDLNKFAKSAGLKKCNLGYLNITLHLLRCQGWLNMEHNNFYITQSGKRAFDLFKLYNEVYKFIKR